MDKKGFSLIEITIVIVVIGIIAGILLPVFSGVIKNAIESSAYQRAKNYFDDYFSNSYSDIKTLDELDGYTVLTKLNGKTYYFVIDNGKLVNTQNVKLGELLKTNGTISIYAKKELYVISLDRLQVKDNTYYNDIVSFDVLNGEIKNFSYLGDEEFYFKLFDKITNIGECLKNNKLLTKITLSSKITKINDYELSNTNLSTIIIPENVKNISGTAFIGCDNLREVIFENKSYWYNINDIAVDVLNSKNNANKYINGTDTIKRVLTKTIKESDFIQVEDVKGNYKSDELWLYIENYELYSIYYEGDSYLEIELPQFITKICDYAFANSSRYIINVKIPQNVKIIGECAFEGTNLYNVEIPSSVEIIKSNAFNGCYNLTSIVLNEGIKEIRDFVFAETLIENINIPKSVESLGINPFANCKNLTNITIDNENIKYVSNDNNCIIEIETQKLITATSNTKLIDISIIGEYAFFEITIENLNLYNVAGIEKNAFYNCNVNFITDKNWYYSIDKESYTNKVGEKVMNFNEFYNQNNNYYYYN